MKFNITFLACMSAFAFFSSFAADTKKSALDLTNDSRHRSGRKSPKWSFDAALDDTGSRFPSDTQVVDCTKQKREDAVSLARVQTELQRAAAFQATEGTTNNSFDFQ